MRDYSMHDLRRWGSDNMRTPVSTMSPGSSSTSTGYSTPPEEFFEDITTGCSTPPDQEFFEVSIDIEDDKEADATPPPTPPPLTPTPPSSLKAEISKSKVKLMKRFSAKKGSNSRVDPAIASTNRRRQLAQLNQTQSTAQRAIKGLKFSTHQGNNASYASWNKAEKKFHTYSIDGFLNRADFGCCIGMEHSIEFALEIFDALSRRRKMKVEKLSKDEFYEYWSQVTDQSFDSRLQLFFDMVDKDEDGRLTEDEVKEIILLSASANRLSGLKERAAEYATFIMEELDPEGLGYIEFSQLEKVLLQTDTYMSYSQAYTRQARSQNLQGRRYKTPIRKITNMFHYLQDNWKRIWILSLWILVMIGMFIWKFLQYKNKAAFKVMGYCLTTSKGASETLKLNMALILVPVCRNTITWLRSTKLAYALPVDDNINFHKMIAVAIVLGIILHVGNNLACIFVRLDRSSPQDYARYLSNFGQPKPTYGDLVRGIEVLTGIVMTGLMAIAFTLATRKFRRNMIRLAKPFDRFTGYNSFWYSHHLLIIVYICLFIHGIELYLVHEWYKKTTWMYLAVPVLLYASERTLRFFRSRLFPVRVLKVVIHPGNVLMLELSKPPQFSYKSGQYMFVQCPAVSPFEWHPFSFTSAPEDEFLSIYIRTLGDWTFALRSLFVMVCQPPVPGRYGLLTADETTKHSLPKLLIDGPYGAPSQDFHKYDVLLLISLGIGATPFISILKDLLNNIVKKEEEEEKASDLNNRRGCPKQNKPFRTTNAYFYWITREQGSFAWFREVMNEVAELDQRGVIEMHNYLTSVYEEGDVRSALVTMLSALNRAKNGVDVISGTKILTHFARPNWRNLLTKLGSKHANARIGVFYCGPTILAKELKALCSEYNRKGSTKFEFHKENF